MTNARAMAGGFDNPVFQSQAVFRQVLEAFARPGVVVEVTDVVVPPAPLHVSTAAFVCAFADEGTPVHVDAAAYAAVLAIDRGQPGTYNIAQPNVHIATDKARTDLSWSPDFRISDKPARE